MDIVTDLIVIMPMAHHRGDVLFILAVVALNVVLPVVQYRTTGRTTSSADDVAIGEHNHDLQQLYGMFVNA